MTNTEIYYIQRFQCCGACGDECITICPKCQLPTWENYAATLPGMSPTDHVTQWVLLVDCSHAVPVSVNLSVYQGISLCFVDLQHTSKSKHQSVVNPFTNPAVLQGINSHTTILCLCPFILEMMLTHLIINSLLTNISLLSTFSCDTWTEKCLETQKQSALIHHVRKPY